jgi:hypothetical protein
MKIEVREKKSFTLVQQSTVHSIQFHQAISTFFSFVDIMNKDKENQLTFSQSANIALVKNLYYP